MLKTKAEDEHHKKVFKNRHCEVKFAPVTGMIEEGINVGVIAFK